MAAVRPIAPPSDPTPSPDVRILELIYQGPLDSVPFQSFVTELQRVTNATRVSMQFYQPDCTERDFRVTATHPESRVDWSALRDVYRQKFMASDPINPYLLKPGQIVTINDGAGSALHRELLSPMQIDYLIRMCCGEADGIRCWLELVGHRPMGPFNSSRDVQMLEGLLPHLARALQLYARIMFAQAGKAVYAEAIDHLAFGSVLLDEEGRILQASGTAKMLASRYQEITMTQERMTLGDHEANRELQAAIAKAVEARRHGAAKPVDLVRMRTRCGALLGFLIVAMPVHTFYQGRHIPSVVIYVSDLANRVGEIEEHLRDMEHLVRKLLNLTKCEATLSVLLADGLPISEAAKVMGITEGTARCYSKRIFEKTGINRQQDLVRLIYKSVALLG